MTYSLSRRRRALAEVEAARDRYALVGHGESFLDELEAVFDAIQAMPLRFPIVYGTVHRALLRRYPFAVFSAFDRRASTSWCSPSFHSAAIQNAGPSAEHGRHRSRYQRQCRRSACPINATLEVVGDRWSLLIVRDLMFAGFRSYKEFLSSDEGIATDILAERLERLKHEGGAGPAASIVKKWKADREGFLAEVREQWMRDDPAAPRTRR